MFPDLKTIAYRRKRLNMTQFALAKKAGISQSLITKIEHGKIMPSYKTACDIFNVLDESEIKEEKHISDIMKKKVLVLKSSDAVSKAIALAKQHSVSQFPVIENGMIIGAVTTNMLIDKNKKEIIKVFMREPFPTLNANTPLSIVRSLLKQEPAIIVLKGNEIIGIVTPEDML
jgi:predicted transcriptional regulator